MLLIIFHFCADSNNSLYVANAVAKAALLARDVGYTQRYGLGSEFKYVVYVDQWADHSLAQRLDLPL